MDLLRLPHCPAKSMHIGDYKRILLKTGAKSRQQIANKNQEHALDIQMIHNKYVASLHPNS